MSSADAYSHLTAQRHAFIRECIEDAISSGIQSLGSKQAVANSLGLKKLHLIKIQNNPNVIPTGTFFRFLQSYGWLQWFKDNYVDYLGAITRAEPQPPMVFDKSSMIAQMRRMEKNYNPDISNSFKFPVRPKKNATLFKESQFEEKKNASYTSFVAGYEAAIERRVIMHEIMKAVRAIGVDFNVTHQSVIQLIPMDPKPSLPTLMRLYRSSGYGLEAIDDDIPPSYHDQTKSSVDVFMAVLQIVPILVSGRLIKARLLHAS